MIGRIASTMVFVALAGLTATGVSAADTPPKGQNCWATHYGVMPAGARTANGDFYDGNRDAAATSLSRNPQLPFGTKVKVTNVKTKKSLTVVINDRGTYAWTKEVPKCLDLTDGAFQRLGGKINPDDGHIVVKEQIVK
ncbi:RlpA-like double-psi beta-barrel domain-containing protein [Amycolatopsis sp. NPDC059657]|uniref:RlpA-like double-psi beta-barrel domain-containing protein n=1 Tax=Amycolatopsis sp. NPDC059657 TaxID=3346899 RepID=UPI003670991D